MTPFDIAQRYVGEIHELPGDGQDHPFIQWCLSLCQYGPNVKDETPWCSAFVQHPLWELRLPRSRSAAARSNLTIGQSVSLDQAAVGYDLVILTRGYGINPG